MTTAHTQTHQSIEDRASYRESSGCTATAVSPRIVSGRVVATGRCSSLSATCRAWGQQEEAWGSARHSRCSMSLPLAQSLLSTGRTNEAAEDPSRRLDIRDPQPLARPLPWDALGI